MHYAVEFANISKLQNHQNGTAFIPRQCTLEGTSFTGKIQNSAVSIGILGNILIIAYFLHRNRRNIGKMSSYHFLMILLAIFDSVTCWGLALSKYQQNWEMSALSCQLGASALEVMSLASIWALVLIFYERYRGILYPFGKRLNKKRYLALNILNAAVSWKIYQPRYRCI